MNAPLIVGLGGTTADASSSAKLLRLALARCETLGARTLCFDGPTIDLPNYGPSRGEHQGARALVEALRAADGVIIASPGYHGGVSGLIKNAIDYTEEMANDARPYLADLPVGLIAVAAGWQGTSSTLSSLRDIAHALRGWPTPMGVCVNSASLKWDATGLPEDPSALRALDLMVGQVMDFCAMRSAAVSAA